MNKNAVFIQRFGAFLIDIIIVSFVASLISTPFVNTKNTEKLQKETTELLTKYTNGDIDQKTYASEASIIMYQADRNNGAYTIAYLILGILYFCVYQFYRGQTIGKKILKIKVESNTGTLTLNQMVVRSLIIDMLLFNFIRFTFCIFASKSTYFMGYASTMIVEAIVILLCGFMAMFRKDCRGLHDIICNTKVTNVK